MKRKLLTGLLMCAGLSAFAQGSKINFTEYDLDNGMHVILHQDKSVPIVTVSVLYHVGSKNEQPDRTGFAHFFEHLMFEGTENIERGEYANMIQAAGGTLNANTSFDRTYYYQVLPSNQLALGMWMEAERMKGAKIDEAGVETQRKVVKEEKKQRIENQPYGSILEQTFSNAYTVHPYRWVPIGAAQYIDQATLPEFMDFYKTFYVPNNATLTIAGDIDVNQAKELVNKYFASIPKGTRPIPRPNVVEPERKQEVRKIVYDNIQLPAVVQAYHIPAQGTPDYYALSMLTTLLSGGESARLNKSIVDKQQKAMFVGSFPLQLEDPGLFMTFGIANMGVKADELEQSINAEFERVKKEPISDKEFQKLRNQVEAEFIQKSASVEDRAEQLANYHVYFKDANLINTELERYLKVTKADLTRVANKYLTPQNRVVLYYLPKSEENKETKN